MLGKSPGQVLCAHCAIEPGPATCACCRLQVCPACAADWTTCSIVPGVELSMGRNRVLLAVDGAGARGLVARKRSLMQRVFKAFPRPSFIDLATRFETPADGAFGSPALVHLCRDGHAVWTAQVVAGDRLYAVVRTTARDAGMFEFRVDAALAGGVTPDDRLVWDFYDNFLYTFDLETKQVIRFVGLPRSLAPLSASLDGPILQLAIGLWEELRVYAAADEQVQLLAKTDLRGEVRTCRMRQGRIATIASDTTGAVLRIFELRADQLRENAGWAPQVDPNAALELSTDGRFCAVGRRDGSVLVRDFERETTQKLDGHRGPVSLLRFTDGEAALISASASGQVFIRKRSGDLFAERCVAVAR